MSQDTLNDIAHARFNELRKKMKLEIQKDIVIVTDNKLTQEKVDQMFDSKHQLSKNEIKLMRESPVLDEAISKAQEIDETFEFIDSLELPPQLSLAIGLIISGHRTNTLLDIESARITLKKYLYEGGFLRAERKEEANNQGT